MAQVSSKFEQFVLEVARENGTCIVEHFTCPKCNKAQFSAHLGAEIMECQDPACDGRCASKAPRPPAPGDLQVKHMEAAANALHAAYAEQQKIELPPLTREEVAALPPAIQLVLARQSVASSRHVLEKMSALAQQFAEMNVAEAD